MMTFLNLLIIKHTHNLISQHWYVTKPQSLQKVLQKKLDFDILVMKKVIWHQNVVVKKFNPQLKQNSRDRPIQFDITGTSLDR